MDWEIYTHIENYLWRIQLPVDNKLGGCKESVLIQVILFQKWVRSLELYQAIGLFFMIEFVNAYGLEKFTFASKYLSIWFASAIRLSYALANLRGCLHNSPTAVISCAIGAN